MRFKNIFRWRRNEALPSLYNNIFLKTKKFLAMFFAVAIVVTIGASVPAHQAQAGWFSLDIFDSLTKWVTGGMMSDNMITKFFYGVIVSLEGIALSFAAILVYFGAWLIDVMLEPSLYVGDPAAGIPGVLNSQAVNIGWTTVRDICNTFFIFFLLLIAFATILRVQKFGNTKTLLVKFIMSIFLINFSMVIAKIIIDIGQVFMYEIVTWMPGGFQGKAGSLTTIVEGFKNQLSDVTKATFADVVSGGFAIIYTIMLGLIYIMLAGFLLIRLVMFAILIILSPFAFLSLVLPSMSKYTSEWFDSLVKHSLFGPVFLFFIFLSATMANELVGQPFAHSSTSNISDISAIVIIIIPNIVALCMLYAVIPVTQRLGAVGSKQLIGGTMGLGKIAMGTYGGIKLAGGLGKKAAVGTVGKSKSIQKAQDSLTRGYHKGLSKVGFRGTAMQKQAAYENKKAERMKEKEGKYGDLKSIDLNILESKAKSRASGTKEDKALWLKAAAAQGKLGDKKYEDTTKEFMKYGEHAMSKKEVDEITDKSLTLNLETSENKKKIEELNTKGMTDESKARISAGANNDEKRKIMKEEIMKEKMNNLVEDGKASKVQGLDNEMAARVWHNAQNSDQRKSSINSMSDKQRKKLAEGYIENMKEVKGSDEQRAAIEQDNMEFSSNAAKLGKGLEEAFAWGGDDVAEKIKEAFSDFSHKDVTKMSSGDLDKYGHNATSKQIIGLEKAGEYKTVRKIKASMARYNTGRLNRENSRVTNPTDEESGERDNRSESRDRPEDIDRDVF